ncbi:MAG: rRNA maturation RNase YbeY [Microcoleaceae cyanobacterium]
MDIEVEVNIQDDFWQSELARENNSSILSDYPQPLISVSQWQQWFSQWLKLVSTDLPPAASYELSLRLSCDEGIGILNAQYRHQNKPTDVLAFASLEANLPHCDECLQSQPLYLGDIVISVNTALSQAQQKRHSLKTELAWLASHGCLHLLGWDHPDLDSFNRMINQQVTLLQAINLEVNSDLPESAQYGSPKAARSQLIFHSVEVN